MTLSIHPQQFNNACPCCLRAELKRDSIPIKCAMHGDADPVAAFKNGLVEIRCKLCDRALLQLPAPQLWFLIDTEAEVK